MSATNSLLKIETTMGTIEIGLDDAHAPLTSEYFRKLADLGALDETSFFRIVTTANNSYNPAIPIHVVQGGRTDDDPLVLPPVKHEPTNETGLTHKKWAVSTARYEVDETYGSFFIVMRDEPDLDHGGRRHPDGQGFAVFGTVTGGHKVVEAMFLKAEENEFLSNKIRIIAAKVC